MEGEVVKNEPHLKPPTILNQIVNAISKIVDPVVHYGGLIGGIMLAGMMFLTFIDIASSMLGKWCLINAHTGFFKPIVGGYEIIELLMVILVSFALSYCAQKKGHIRVDVILQYVPKKASAWFDIFAYLFSAVFYVLIMWQAVLYALDNISSNNVTAILFVPTAPFNLILALGAFLLVLVFIRDFFNAIGEAVQ